MRKDIFDELRSDILEQRLTPGTPLKEIQLSERFNVSRTPVRDALSRLEEAGLAVRQNRGLVVCGVSPESVMHVYELRILLEEQAAGEAALNRSLSDVLTLEALCERDEQVENPTEKELVEANLEFHAAIWKASTNPVLIDLLERLMVHMAQVPSTTLTSPGRQDSALQEHRAMVKAISERDADTARDIARKHFTEAR